MNKVILITLLLFFTIPGLKNDSSALSSDDAISELPYASLYKELGMDSEISFQAFYQAMTGYEQIKKKKSLLTIIDFSKPSTDKRLYVINPETKEILYKSVVAHGRNSGDNYATSFSNKLGSCQSSLGFFLTENTYTGRNGFSLIIDGLEKGINDNAKKRAVVIHGADYLNPSLGKSCGRLGRSWGCPALPRDLNKEIIDAIKGGSVIYAFSKNHNDEYLKESSVLHDVLM